MGKLLFTSTEGGAMYPWPENIPMPKYKDIDKNKIHNNVIDINSITVHSLIFTDELAWDCFNGIRKR